MGMQPRPIEETSSPWLPSLRLVIIRSSGRFPRSRPSARLSLRSKIPGQSFEFLDSRKRREAVDGGGGRPWQLFAGPCLDERREPAGVVQHRRAHVDQPVQTLGPREHPAHAVRAEIVTGGAVQAADDRLARGHLKAVARDRCAQRIGACRHPLAAGAVAGHGEQRRRADLQAHLTAATAAVPGQIPAAHDRTSLRVPKY